MTDAEIEAAARADTRMNRARQAFHDALHQINRAQRQGTLGTAVNLWRMEFEAVREICVALGIFNPPWQPIKPEDKA